MWGAEGLSHLDDLMFCQKYTWDVMYEQEHCHDEAANYQLLMAAAFWIIWIVCMEECSSLMQNLMQICCCTCSVIFNVMATHSTYFLNSIYHHHWLVQRSRHCSCMHMPVHSPWLPGYIDVAQAILFILTMAGLFLDRPHHILLYNIIVLFMWLYWYIHIIDK